MYASGEPGIGQSEFGLQAITSMLSLPKSEVDTDYAKAMGVKFNELLQQR